MVVWLAGGGWCCRRLDLPAFFLRDTKEAHPSHTACGATTPLLHCGAACNATQVDTAATERCGIARDGYTQYPSGPGAGRDTAAGGGGDKCAYCSVC